MINLKNALNKNKRTIGSWISLGHPSIAEIMAKSGFDWLTIDMEHSVITLGEVQNLIQVIELCKTVPLVRVSANDPTLIKRVMDAGAYGVIVPMVNTKDDALRAVSAVKYPPAGKRGVGLARAQGYGFSFPDYRDRINKESVVIVQIEHVDAIKNLESILTTPGVDGSIVGPYDLSGSLGVPGKFGDVRLKQAILSYEKVSRRLNKPMGFHVVEPDIKEILRFKKKGYSFLAVGLDALYLGIKCREVLKAL